MTNAQAVTAASPFPSNIKDMANAIRALAMDAVQAANSGHPGMPMGMADVAVVLWAKHIKFDPKNPEWADRDRFVLSGGHGSMLLYAVNYLLGYEAIGLQDIKNFRQLGSICAGHPEVEHHAGIETTTGPLGQGVATAVGMALGERIMNARFGDELVDHYTYVMCGDGDLMEGISHEAASMAGHLKLDRLIVLYDDNGICIDGSTDMTFTDDTVKRFESYGWDVQSINGHDYTEIDAALEKAQQTKTPSLICCKTHIGYGAPTKQDTASAHGSPLGAEEIAGARKFHNWPHAPFVIPEDVLGSWRALGAVGADEHADWQDRLLASGKQDVFLKAVSGDISGDIAPIIQSIKEQFVAEKCGKATRATSGMVLDKLVPAVAELVGGSADLTGSNLTKATSDIVEAGSYGGQYIYYGVREFGMAAAMNGLALHGGIIPYGGTFLVFTDYCRPAIRLSALMKQRVIYVMTHDSIGLGEDGPTHQPVEHLASLRAMPNLYVFRPCDGVETAESWQIALEAPATPSILALTRQGVPALRGAEVENLSARGAYVLKETSDKPAVTLFASGSEVTIAHEAYKSLVHDDVAVRLVSCPCLDLFWEQDDDYIHSLICNDSIKIAVEAGVRQGWDGIIGAHGSFIGMNDFGASAPIEVLYEHFGITAEAVVKEVKRKLERK
jgi:transketolase